MDAFFLIATLVKCIAALTVVLSLVPLSVYLERRVSAIIQDRVGPNRVGLPTSILGFKKDIGIFGLFQPAADGIKLLLKEDFTPSHVNKPYYWLAPALVLIPSIVTSCVIPFSSPLHLPDWVPFFGGRSTPLAIADIDAGALFILAIASLGVYGIVLAGWSSNSKYPFLGGVRSSAQMISYEISLGLALIPALLIFGDLNLGRIVDHQSREGWLLLPIALGSPDGAITNLSSLLLWIPVAIAFVIFTVSLFAETNRAPFDLPECETELVAGYHTEYSSMKFALFFMGEYAAMVIGSALIITLFLGGWSLPLGLDNYLRGADGAFPWWASLFIHLPWFLTKVLGFIVFFIWVRWTVPRFRYDQLMNLGWVIFFEAALANVLLTAALLTFARF